MNNENNKDNEEQKDNRNSVVRWIGNHKIVIAAIVVVVLFLATAAYEGDKRSMISTEVIDEPIQEQVVQQDKEDNQPILKQIYDNDL